MRIQFDPRNGRDKAPFGAVCVNREILFHIAVCTQSGEGEPRSAALLIRRDGEDLPHTVNGALCLEETSLPGFSFSHTTTESGLYFYRFSVSFADGKQEVSPEFQLTVYDEDYRTPDWLKEGLMYQIFPDRFARSKRYEPPEQNKRHTLRTDWGGVPHSGPDEAGIVWNDDFFGGNLKGIMEQLDQLRELGVTVLYLNPIFSAFSNHRYDTADYLHIDPLLGTEEDLKELCGEAAKRGIRILLDGVFNHTGCDSIYFNKYGRFPGTGAYQSQESPYYSWYTFTDFPDQYDCWWGIQTLPAVKKTEQSYLEYVLTGPDSVIRHWMRCGVSGFRLDVADELPDSFLDTLRQVVKEENSEAAVIGEVWEDASNKISYGNRRRYFQGKQLDSVMNYPMKDGIIRFVMGKISAQEFHQLLGSLQEHYPAPAFSSLMNILGTHDTARIFTVLAEEEAAEEDVSWAMREERKRQGRGRLFLALLIWAFLPGIPCIYYGDELGMEGGKDPQNRRCYVFENRDRPVYDFYRRLLRFRKDIAGLEQMTLCLDEPCVLSGSEEKDIGGLLRMGKNGTLCGDKQEENPACFRFSRIGKRDRLIIQVNPGEHSAVLCPGLSHREYIKDFVTAGRVDFSDLSSFRLSPGAGAAVLISEKPPSKASVTK